MLQKGQEVKTGATKAFVKCSLTSSEHASIDPADTARHIRKDHSAKVEVAWTCAAQDRFLQLSACEVTKRQPHNQWSSPRLMPGPL